MEAEIESRDGCLGVAVWMIMVFICALILIALGGCRSVQYVPVETVKHDSIYISKHDTISITNIVKEKEYIEVKDSTSTTLDEEGKILKQETWHNKTIIKEKNDSLNYYKALTDSLASVKQREKEVIVEVEKPLTKWQERFMSIGKVSLGIGIGLLVVGIVWLILWLRKRFGK